MVGMTRFELATPVPQFLYFSMTSKKITQKVHLYFLENTTISNRVPNFFLGFHKESSKIFSIVEIYPNSEIPISDH